MSHTRSSSFRGATGPVLLALLVVLGLPCATVSAFGAAVPGAPVQCDGLVSNDAARDWCSQPSPLLVDDDSKSSPTYLVGLGISATATWGASATIASPIPPTPNASTRFPPIFLLTERFLI